MYSDSLPQMTVFVFPDKFKKSVFDVFVSRQDGDIIDFVHINNHLENTLKRRFHTSADIFRVRFDRHRTGIGMNPPSVNGLLRGF